MIQELQMCKEHYAEILEMHLREIFVMIHRHLQSATKVSSSQIAEDIDAATLFISTSITTRILTLKNMHKNSQHEYKLVYSQFQAAYQIYSFAVHIVSPNL